MTNSSLKGKKSVVVVNNPYAKKPVISNPYAKVTPKVIKKPIISTTNNNAANNKPSYNRAAGTTPKAARHVTSNINIATKQQPPVNAAVSVSRSNNPYAATTKAVTPTPKKKQMPHKHHTPSATISGSSTTRATASSSYATPKTNASNEVVNRSIPSAKSSAPLPSNNNSRAQPNNNMNNNKPKSLKQSLKSQIAQIKRRKQLLVQQKEADKLRKQRQVELQKLQVQQQREAKLVLQRQQRHQVQSVVETLVSRVEQRIELEGKFGGIHYSIGEAMSYMINVVERNDQEEKRLIREEKARLRRVKKERKGQVRQCLGDIVSGVEWRVYGVGVHQQHLMQQQQQMQQQHQMQLMAMKAQQQQQQQQYNHPSYIPPTQPGVATVPHYAGYYPMQQMPAHTASGYPMPMLMPATHHHHPTGVLPRPQHPHVLPSTQTIMNPITTTATTKPAAQSKPLILSAHALTNPHSPYLTSHQLLANNHNGHEVCVIKKEVKDSFGVTLRYESKSVLVAREEVPKVTVVATVTSGGGVATSSTTSTVTTTTEKKPRRKRETFGVLNVVDANKARFANERKLQPGDIILLINGRDVGGMTFGEACRFISTAAARCSVTGEIRCVLTVARRKVALPTVVAAGTNYLHRLPHSTSGMQPTPAAIPLIPFSIFGENVIGDFTYVEWCALIQAFPIVSRALTTGIALLPVARKDICTAVIAKDDYRNFLNQRSGESMQAKMAFEGKRIEVEAKQKAEEYWKVAWEGEMKRDADNENNSLVVENYLTDAQRSRLRSKARPTTGCKCGSKTHTFVSDPKCVLFRDVKQFCEQHSINIEDEKRKVKGKKISTKGKGKLESAYIRRFNQLREETAATKEEAEFVLKMEQNQCFGMKKAVFAPSSLCTVVLSAVAAVMDLIPKDRLLDSAELLEVEKTEVDEPKNALDSDDDDSDDEDMPLNALVKPLASHKRVATNSKLPSPKRPKQSESSNDHSKSKAVPSAYILGEILKQISKTYGHLFLEPSHPNYAWQQRHRSVITTPIRHEIMFAGNPRKPGTLSFENVRFILTEERLARLKNNWLNPDQLKLPPQSAEEMEQWNDEWKITHLSSDAVTGIAHEIDVLENLGILTINKSGSVVFVHGWERRVPHMVLNEMKDAWGSDMDVNNLHCIHEKIMSSLEHVWEHDEDGWRFESEGLDDDDDEVYEDEEYELRRQIFLENYDAFVNSTKGVGEFGI